MTLVVDHILVDVNNDNPIKNPYMKDVVTGFFSIFAAILQSKLRIWC